MRDRKLEYHIAEAEQYLLPCTNHALSRDKKKYLREVKRILDRIQLNIC